MKLTQKFSQQTLADLFWGKESSIWFVLLIAIVVLFAFLGAKELWTQEWRWANISHQMMLRHDYFHPYLAGHDYYDKPLLSYWLIIGIAWLIGHFNLWAIRLPSAIAGLITIWSTYEIGKIAASRKTGLIAAWMLLSSFYFIFWSRVGNTDILNIAGIMLALLWYFKHRDKPGIVSFSVFFTLLAVASLLKGLIAPAVTMVVLIPDLLYQNRWKKYVTVSLFLGLMPAFIVYFAPFVASTYFNPHHYAESGLIEVFRENILRYIAPFDHKQPIYIYFIYLPLAIAPWIFLTVPALITFPARWRQLAQGSRWFFWSFLFIFLFFTLSGSRRNYYVLPMIPFAILFTADWVRFHAEKNDWINQLSALCALIFTLLILMTFVVAMPIAFLGGGPQDFANRVKQQAEKIQPWNTWHVQVLATRDNMTFYLRSKNMIVAKKASPLTSSHPTVTNLIKDFPALIKKDPNTIIVIGEQYQTLVKKLLPGYTRVTITPNLQNRLFHNLPDNAPVAFIPAHTGLSISTNSTDRSK